MRLDDSNDLNVVDQGRGGGSFGGFGGGGYGGGGGGGNLLFMFLPMLFSRLGCFGTAIVVGLFLLFSGGLGGIGSMLGGGSGYAPAVQQGAPVAANRGDAASICASDPSKRLACNVMANVNRTWAQLIPNYQRPTLQFYTSRGQSGCGAAQSAMGPFYCPADQGVYLDVEFFQELTQRFGAPGDAAQAYVVAHEVGHHVQNLLGTSDKVSRAQQQAGRLQANRLSVLLELQADCYAGVWVAHARNPDGSAVMEPGDAQEALRAASAIGDDTLQKETQGRVVPESFTHGTSAQRQYWLNRGMSTGDPRQCDTFAVSAS